MRATYIASNPVQAFIDPKSGEVRGPGANIAREIARRLNVAVKITGVGGPAGVILRPAPRASSPARSKPPVLTASTSPRRGSRG